MEIIIKGALIGLGVAVVLLVFDYTMSKKNAAERAARLKSRKVELDPTEVKSLKSLARFCMLLPFLFAAGAWLIWG